jgi:signal transduction histidine kinase
MLSDVNIEGSLVLIVDDDARNRELLGEIMTADGYRVVFAADGQEALDHLAEDEEGVDLVLLDVMMPRVDGIEACRRIRADEKTRSIPVIMVTALSSREDRLRGIEVGANDILTKPLEILDVRLRVRNALEQKHLADRVQSDFDRLQELERLRDSLVHMVVHDLRSPLTNLRLCLSLLETSPSVAANEATLVEDSLAATERITSLVNTVLDMSRLEDTSLPLDRQVQDVDEVVERALESVSFIRWRRKLLVTFAERPLTAFIDPQLMSRVIENLALNAFKATDDDGIIEVAARRAGSEVVVEVSDNGRGIPKDVQSSVFEKFGRGPSGKGRPQSWGLGLAFVRMAVHAHGGEVGFDSEEGMGTRFWFSIPETPPATDDA